MRIKEHYLLSAVAVAVLSVAFLHDVSMKADAATGGDKIARHRMAASLVQQPDGTVVPYANWAAYGWHLGTEVPDRPDGVVNPATGVPVQRWPMVAEYGNGNINIVWYWGGWFRSANGSKWGKPARWAYLRQAEEVWNAGTKQWEVPGLNGVAGPVLPPVAPSKAGVHMDDVAGQQLVDLLKRSFTWERIQDFGDLSPYDEPDTGAPMKPVAP